MEFILCALLPAPVVMNLAAIFDDRRMWLLVALLCFDVYLLYEVVQLRRKCEREDTRARAAGKAARTAAERLATNDGQLGQQPRPAANHPCSTEQ